MGYVAGIFLLIIVFIFYYLLTYESDIQKNIREEALKEDKLLEGKRKVRRSISGESISYDENNHLNGLKNKFEIPKGIVNNVEDLKDPKVSKKRLNSFIEWLKEKDSNLLKTLKSKKSLDIPEMALTSSVVSFIKDECVVKSPDLDYDFDAYRVSEWKYYFDESRSIQEWVKLLNYEKMHENVVSEFVDPYLGEENIGEHYYTKDEDLEIPLKYELDAVDVGGFDRTNILLYCVLDVFFWDKKITINQDEFTFKKNEKEHLVTLLMASYKPSLLKRIIEGLK